MWHKRYGHLDISSVQKLASENLVGGFDFNLSQDLTFYEACPQGKQHRSKTTKRMGLLIFTTEVHEIIGEISNIHMHSALHM